MSRASGSRAAGATAASGEREEALELSRRMRLIRRFEDTIQSLFQRGEVHGTTHLYSGEEAVAVGVGSVLTAQDRVAGTYRGHGHALAVGVDPQALLDEMLGRATGVCGGRAGSMNVVDLEHGLIGCFGIIGGSIAAATGAAIALRRTGGVAVAFFGDGTTNHGYFHEYSQNPATSWFQGVPGLKVVAPSTPADAKALLKAAIRDDNPVIFLEHKRLYAMKEEAGPEVEARLGEAAVVGEGADVTLVSAMKGVHDCLAAAELLAEDGIAAEVIDLRTLRPLDVPAILRWLERTNRLAVVEEGPVTGGWAGEIVSIAAEQGLHDVDNVWRIATPDHPIPYSPALEDAFLPGPRGDRRVGARATGRGRAGDVGLGARCRGTGRGGKPFHANGFPACTRSEVGPLAIDY